MHRNARAMVVGLVLILLAACGGGGVESENEMESGRVSPEASPEHHTISVATSVEAIPTVKQLIWQSDLIVRGRFTETLPAQHYTAIDVPEGDFPPESVYDSRIFTDTVFQIDEVLRGTAQTQVLVRQIGGTIVTVTYEQIAGTELPKDQTLVLFLRPDAHGQQPPAKWLTGGPQGLCFVEGDKVNTYDKYPITSYDQLKQTIADTLAQPPLSLPPGYLVPLEEAPAGPDL